MANLGQKGGIYLARFRYGGREYKKSLKTRDRKEAESGRRIVENAIHRLTTGTLTIPTDVDAGAFIVSGGTVAAAAKAANAPPLAEAVRRFEDRQEPLVAPAYLKSQSMHLRHLARHLGGKAKTPLDRLTVEDLRGYLQTRLKTRHPNTVERERQTLRQFFGWATEAKLIPADPMTGVKRVGEKPAPDRFRTRDEIAALLARGGHTDDEVRELWTTLFLLPHEVGELLDFVKEKADDPRSILLHAIPAYTGIRRGETLGLTWDHVDLARGTVTAHSRKQSRKQKQTPRTIDLHADLVPLLVEAEKAGGRYVVRDEDDGQLQGNRGDRLFWRPMRHTDWHLENDRFKVGFHTYRHSFASNLAVAGIDQRVINELMGHTTEEMAKRYRHLIPAKTKAAVGVLDYGSER